MTTLASVGATSRPAPAYRRPRLSQRPDVVVPAIAFAVIATVYTLLALRQHETLLTSGYDLGIFEQEVRSYAHGHLPTSTLKGPGFALLSDHFSPIVAVLAPLYLIFPTAQTLLVAQAVLLAAGAVPLVRWAQRDCGTGTAVVVAVVYGLSWELAEAVGFDFHEIAFAVPLIAWSLTALGEQRLRAAVWFAAPLVLVKEDLGLTVAVIGALVAWRGERLLGTAAVVLGIVATLVETYVIIPSFAATSGNAYTAQINLDDGVWHVVTELLNSDTKLATVLLLLAPTAFLALRSPLILVAVPTLLWRFAADNPAYWGTSYHYSAVLAPVMTAAMIDMLVRLPARPRWRANVAAILVTLALVGAHPLSRLWSEQLWHRSPTVNAADRLMAQIPTGVTVSASNWLAPHLTNRDDVTLFGYTPLSESKAQWVVVDTREPLTYPISAEQQRELIADAQTTGYQLIESADGVYLLHRSSAP